MKEKILTLLLLLPLVSHAQRQEITLSEGWLFSRDSVE